MVRRDIRTLSFSLEDETEFAEYTSAQDRIALGKKSRKAEASQRRNNMKELIEDAYV